MASRRNRKQKTQLRRRRSSQSRTPRFTSEALEVRMVLSADMAGAIMPIDGVGNNEPNPELGSAGTELLRIVSADYADGISAPSGADRPSAREISNMIVAQDESIENTQSLTNLTWLWGQFIDHDIDLTGTATPAESLPIEVPQGDPYFDPTGTGAEVIDFSRSIYTEGSGTSIDDPRAQINQITAFLDGSMVYGSDAERAVSLRTLEGGKLKTSDGDLLPFNTEGIGNAGGPSDTLFVAGDIRVNENVALSAMHTLFVREHNRLAEEIGDGNPSLSDEEIYQQARAIVVGEIQSITYNEYLPALLGERALQDYGGYDPNVNPAISVLFSTAAYRFGHSMLSSELARLDADGQVADEGNLSLSDAFFSPTQLTENGIDSLLRGLSASTAQEIDPYVVDDVRNFLFGPPGAGGFDLVSLNIQRGRDHGLPSYNQVRLELGLEPVQTFSDITSDPELQSKLEETYGSVDQIDAWVGMLSEDHVDNANVGQTTFTVLVEQFQRLRDGDRFWYQNVFQGQQLQDIQNTTLADVIERNTEIAGLQENVFYDSSVLYHKVAVGDGPANWTLYVENGKVALRDNATQTLVQSFDVDQIDTVILVGANGQDDQIMIDIGRANLPMESGILVYAGHHDHDELTVLGTKFNDSFNVDRHSVDHNGTSIGYAGIDHLTIRGGSGDDFIRVSPSVVIPTMLHGGFDNDVIFGGSGNDEIYGSNGDDKLYGSAGDDVLAGGNGADRMYGGAGHDVIRGNRFDLSDEVMVPRIVYPVPTTGGVFANLPNLSSSTPNSPNLGDAEQPTGLAAHGRVTQGQSSRATAQNRGQNNGNAARQNRSHNQQNDDSSPTQQQQDGRPDNFAMLDNVFANHVGSLLGR